MKVLLKQTNQTKTPKPSNRLSDWW